MRFILLALVLIPISAHSGIFKCVVNGVPTYQSNPCPANAELKSDVSHLESKAPAYSDNRLNSQSRQNWPQSAEGKFLREQRNRRYEDNHQKSARKRLKDQQASVAKRAKLNQEARAWAESMRKRQKSIARCEKRKKRNKDYWTNCN